MWTHLVPLQTEAVPVVGDDEVEAEVEAGPPPHVLGAWGEIRILFF